MSSLSASLPSPCCLQGSELFDEPKGKTIEFANVVTYQAGQDYEKSSKVVLIFSDVFGLKLNNFRPLADSMAEQSGCTVLVPDLFDDRAMSPTVMSAPPTVSETKNYTWWDKIKANFSMLKMLLFNFVPFLLRHRPSSKMALFDRLIETVPAHAKLGLAGYCYGAKPIWLALTKHASRVDACFIAHPSMSTVKDLVDAPTRLSVAFAEADFVFPAANMQKVQAELKKRDDPPSEVVFYDDTQHGFAARPTAQTRPAFEKALTQAAKWFAQWLA